MHDKLSKIMEIKSRFDHFNVNVTDLDRSLKFYAEALGLREIGRKQAADGSFVLVYLGDGESPFRLELTWLRDHAAAPYELGENESHLCMRVAGDYDAVREAIDRATGASRAAAAAHQRAEKLRDALLTDNDKLTEYVASHPEVDVQQLRTLIRLARKEKEAAKPPKYFRELYRFLHAAELPALTLEKADDEEADA